MTNGLLVIDEKIKELSALKRIVKRGEVTYRGDNREEDAGKLEQAFNMYGIAYNRYDHKNFYSNRNRIVNKVGDIP